MIDLKVVKAILAFYLDTKRVDWNLIHEDIIKYPEAKTTEREKLDFICRLVAKAKIIAKVTDADIQNAALIELSKTLQEQASIEAANHRSASMKSVARYFTDYPAFSKVLLAIRSYCLNCAYETDYAGINEEERTQTDLALLKDMHYYRLFTGEQGDNAGFVDIIKYEDYLHGSKNYGEKKFQDIASFNVFFDKYTTLTDCFNLLDGLIKIHFNLLTLGTATSVRTLSLVGGDKEKSTIVKTSAENEKLAGMGNK